MLQSGTEFADTCATWSGDHKSDIYEPQRITIAIMNCNYLDHKTHMHSGSVTFGRVKSYLPSDTREIQESHISK